MSSQLYLSSQLACNGWVSKATQRVAMLSYLALVICCVQAAAHIALRTALIVSPKLSILLHLWSNKDSHRGRRSLRFPFLPTSLISIGVHIIILPGGGGAFVFGILAIVAESSFSMRDLLISIRNHHFRRGIFDGRYHVRRGVIIIFDEQASFLMRNHNFRWSSLMRHH